MKRILSLLLSGVLTLSLLCGFVGCSAADDTDLAGGEEVEKIETPYAGTTLNVYNWGEYISNGDDGSVDLIDLFERTYDINVIYTNYASNEEMYTKLKSGTVTYDVIIPSDYMIARLIDEDMLQKLNYDNIPNLQNVSDAYLYGQYFDCGGEGGAPEYSVPYTVGMVGVIYNGAYVDEEDVADKSWSLLWNEDYKKKILMFDNARDAFGVSMLSLGLDVNSRKEADWEAGYRHLAEQKPLLKGYVMDQVFNQMEGENAYIGVYYAGDCLTMMEENENLRFFYPTEGTNMFVDSMCIPKCADNVGAAELFINFMLDTDVAIENALYIYYASPVETVIHSEYYREEMGEEAYAILYDTPADYRNADGSINTKKACYYANLDGDTLDILSRLWARLK